MAIKAGQFLHDAQGFIVDRIQTGGVSSLNIPSTTVYELGNYRSVGIVRDIPDLTFDVESNDVSCEMEALITGADASNITNGQSFDFGNSMPLDIISPFKAGPSSYNIVQGVVVPYLNLDTVAYKFGVGQDSTESYTFHTDSNFYVPGLPKYYEFTITSGANQTYTLPGATPDTMLAYVDSGTTTHVLSACAKNSTTKTYTRLFYSTNYTDTTHSITVVDDLYAAGYTKLHITYGVAATGNTTTYAQTIHPSTSVKPAAVRGKDIVVYVSDGAATPTYNRWSGVQNFDVTRKVTLQNNEEFDNHHYVSSDYDVPTVSGQVTVRSVDSADLFTKIRQIANVSSSSQIAGPNSSIALGLKVKIKHPDTGTVLKTIYVDDARFDVPGIQGRVQQKIDVSFKFTSDQGDMVVYNGDA